MATVYCKKENIRNIKPERVGYVGELKDNLRNGKVAVFRKKFPFQIPVTPANGLPYPSCKVAMDLISLGMVPVV